MIVLDQAAITELLNNQSKNFQDISFYSLDDGDVFSSLNILSDKNSENCIKGRIIKVKDISTDVTSIISSAANSITIIVAGNEASPSISGWINVQGKLSKSEVTLVPIKENIYSRTKSLYETDVLKDKTVVIIGLGSGGSPIAIELSKSGVGNFVLIDNDRLEIENVVRHVCGISDIGRFKTNAIREAILNKNPNSNIQTIERNCSPEWLPELREIIKTADLVYCCTDNRESRVVINRACIAEKKVCIYGGTFRRAYGGQVLRVIPEKTLCYQCFIDLLPDVAQNQEISNQEQANNFAYTDRPVPIEPGLATDILPIAIMCVKLGIIELLKGSPTSLSSLYTDLNKPWYIWLNRREENTEYQGLNPMDDSEGGFRILSWYGIDVEKNPSCPTCGNFFAEIDIESPITVEDIKKFSPE